MLRCPKKSLSPSLLEEIRNVKNKPLSLLVLLATSAVASNALAQSRNYPPSDFDVRTRQGVDEGSSETPFVYQTEILNDSATNTREIVVDFQDGTTLEEAREAVSSLGLNLVPNSIVATDNAVMIARVPAAREMEVLRALRGLSNVEGADENITMRMDFTPNDPQLGEQWHMARVGAPQAWNFSCGRGVTVAVIDTGVACENYNEFSRVKDLENTNCAAGYNFVNDTTHANDDQGHGTHVAGTIAQTTNNGFGVAGLAYCSTILPVKVLNANGSGTLADVADGIRWAGDHGAQVINLSLGGGRRSKVLENAVAHARSRGVVVVCAAGNNGRYVESPASEPGSFAVSAIDSGDAIAWFSSRGPEVDIAAPGVNVLQHTICEHGRNQCQQFAAWSGTSMAAPHVAGVAAMVVGLGVTNPDRVESILQQTAVRPEHGDNNKELYGAGIVSASEAVTYVQSRAAVARAVLLLLASLGLAFYIRSKKGELANPAAWVPTALMSGVGLFFLPWILPRIVPGVDFLMRPVGDWSVLFGVNFHKWLPLANAPLVFGLLSLTFGKKAFRTPLAGFSLGTATYLLSIAGLGFHRMPVGTVLGFLWILVNVAGCLWVARIGLDRKTAD